MQGGSKKCGGTGQETEKAVKGVSITGLWDMTEKVKRSIACIATIPVSLEAARRRSAISELQTNKIGLNNYGRIYKRS